MKTAGYAGILYHHLSSNATRADIHIVVSMGQQGVMWICPKDFDINNDTNHVAGTGLSESDGFVIANSINKCVYVQANPVHDDQIRNTSGAGDTFCGSLVHYHTNINGGKLSVNAIKYALAGAKLSLMSNTAIPVDIKSRIEKK